MNRFTLTKTPLSELKIIRRQQLVDSRGFFSRLFCSNDFALCGWKTPIAQINHTFTGSKGTIRGMHFQYPPHLEQKVVTCLRGEVWDVVIDIRAESPTFLQWHGVLLSQDNLLSLFIPKGFAHGFQTITNDVELLYYHSTAYNAESEGGLNPQDTKLMIDWPVTITEISERDKTHPNIHDDFKGVSI